MKHTLTKYDATGNIFLLTESATALRSEKKRSRYSALARNMCARLTGADADGLLVISPTKSADIALDVFNADGSWAERSGNGLRIAVAHARQRAPRRKRWTILCGGDTVKAQVLGNSTAGTTMISTEVGCPVFEESVTTLLKLGKCPKLKTMRIGKRAMPYLPVEVGNPHVVIPLQVFPKRWQETGERISTHRQFTDGVNVEFAKVITPRRVEVKVFERGVGETRSSGTGASAVVAALSALGKVSSRVAVQFSRQNANGERLVVSWKDKSQPIVVSGAVRRLFDIQVNI